MGDHLDTLSVHEAAERLGVTEKTIRRRIKAGTLHAQKVATSQGYEWRVQVDGQGDQVDTHMSSRVDTAPDPAGIVKALEMIEELQAQNRELTAAAAHWQSRAHDQEQRAIHAEEQVKLLMAPKDEPLPADAPTATPAKRPWWKVWGT